jgi:hypothetical protein
MPVKKDELSMIAKDDKMVIEDLNKQNKDKQHLNNETTINTDTSPHNNNSTHE